MDNMKGVVINVQVDVPNDQTCCYDGDITCDYLTYEYEHFAYCKLFFEEIYESEFYTPMKCKECLKKYLEVKQNR